MLFSYGGNTIATTYTAEYLGMSDGDIINVRPRPEW
jgi:hypothetical protein